MSKVFWIITSLSVLLILVCIRWIDYPLAFILDRITIFNRVSLTRIIIPDLLMPACVGLFVFAWIGYGFCKETGKYPSLARLALPIGVVTPIVYPSVA
jgi:hypothetical protein